MGAEPTTTSPLPDLPNLCLAITEHAPLPMVTLDGATRIVHYGNPAFCRMMGLPQEAIVGKPFDKLLPEKDHCVTLIEHVFRTKKPASYTEQQPDKPHPVFWSYTIWPVMEIEGLVGVMIQVTETAEFHGKTIAMNEALLLGSIHQHELTEAAEALNAQLRAEIVTRENIATELLQNARQLAEKARLLDLSHDAIVVRGMDGEIRYWNHGAEEIYGWSSGEALGKISHELLRTEFPTPLEEMTEVLHRTDRWIGELVHTRRDGRRITVLARKTLDRDSDGNPAAVMENLTDITARRAMEDALAERALQLARADRSKDEFLAMLAHELRNPLAPLRTAAEILRTPGADAAECAQAQAIMARQLENMTRLLDDLLDVSRITAGKIELRRQPSSLADILTAAASVAQPGIAARAQELAVSLPAEPIFLNADATRLEQVFGNLLTNACKYSYTGGHITLSAERVAGTEPPEAVIRVSDDGMGIAPDLLPHIFDLFVQSTRSLDREHGGLGIGLTLVRRLVQLHGGSVEASSEGLTQGSEFTVRLPILAARAAAPAPPAPAARETPRRILIVDDNEDSTRSMAILQKRRGHETRSAFNGPDAVVAAAEFLPDVVLLDIGLPGMDGFEVARRLRAMPVLDGAFLVAMSGYGSVGDRATAQAAGFDEYMVKPVDLDRLRELLRGRE
jgi:two-component system CheB/CheR fusion protein